MSIQNIRKMKKRNLHVSFFDYLEPAMFFHKSDFRVIPACFKNKLV